MERTFWIGSATVARFLERKVGNMLGGKGLLGMTRAKALEEACFNMTVIWRWSRVVATTPVYSWAKYFERLLASRKAALGSTRRSPHPLHHVHDLIPYRSSPGTCLARCEQHKDTTTYKPTNFLFRNI